MRSIYIAITILVAFNFTRYAQQKSANWANWS
jgi:hypothetical protein